MDLTDAQWAVLEPLFRPQRRGTDGRGRFVAKHACGTERSLLGSTHGCSLARPAVSLSALSDLPSALPTMAAQWTADTPAAKPGRGLTRPREARSERILHRRQLQWREKGALVSALQSAAKAAKSWQSQTAMVFLSPCTWPEALRLVKQNLVEPTLDLQRFLAQAPKRMIGDRAYDSDPLDQRIHERYGVQLIAPHKFVRVAAATQDGRVLRRYRRRWKVERLFRLVC